MYSQGNNAAIITAAGSSQRMQGQRKEFLNISGKSLIEHTIIPFVESRLFNSILITTSKESYQPMVEALKSYKESNISVIIGGATRQDSVRKALEYLSTTPPETVLIHDGARPWITEALITTVTKGAHQYHAVAPVIPPRDTIKLITPTGENHTHLIRSEVMAVQTPQGFCYSKILDAHRKAQEDNITVTDDTELYARYYGTVYTVEGDRQNQKITYPEDIGAAHENR